MKSEIGGGSVTSCELYVCQAIAYLNANSDGKSWTRSRSVEANEEQSILDTLVGQLGPFSICP